MRTSIRRPAAFAAVACATCVVLSLTLTACGGGEGVQDEGAAWVPKQAGTGSGGESSEMGEAASGPRNSAARTDTEKKIGTNKAPTCAADDVEISAAKQDGVPTTHITLTATNISGHSCTLLRYPLIAFGDIPTAKDVPAVAKSKPGAPVVLNAGAPAYAAVRINKGGIDERNRAVTTLHVNLFAADGPAEGSKRVSASKGGIAVHDAVAKTGYWTPQLRDGADEF
ncbi:DUF4232 domain-containing protein [Streptomyces sp. NPDC058257]|uniref:DUF4232 domain-containing protein n=1 Tax=Streptomyces sp. NPDC058257 TaxID=3346409 RepID=UPI0036E046B3